MKTTTTALMVVGILVNVALGNMVLAGILGGLVSASVLWRR